MPNPRSAVVIAKMFPPEAAVGVHRVVGLCRRLAERRWRTTVIAARPGPQTPVDTNLLRLVPNSVRVVRTAAPDLPVLAAGVLNLVRPGRARGDSGPAASADSSQASPTDEPARPASLPKRILDWLSWWLHVPDGCTGWFAPALWAGARAALRDRPDVIFASGPVWTAHLVGAALSRAFDIPLVADFRDPWCGSRFRNIPWPAHRHFNDCLERAVLRSAARVTCAWDGIRKHLARRYPRNAPPMSTILNGFNPETLDPVGPTRLDESRCVLLHAGGFYGPRSPVPLFGAMRRLQQTRPKLAERILAVLLGPTTYNGVPMDDLARRQGLEKLVRVMPRVPHREAMALLKGADVALLFGQSGEESLASVPGKVYEYVGMSKAVLSIGAGKEACDVLAEGGCALWQAPADDTDAICANLIDIVGGYERGELASLSRPAQRERLTQSRMAAQIERVLTDAAQDSRTRDT